MKFTKLLKRKLITTIEHIPMLAVGIRRLRHRPKNIHPRLTTFGFSFIGTDEMIAGRYESNVTNLVMDLMDQTDVFINIGANSGYYCCLSLNNKKMTVAVEPIKTNLELLYRNIRKNGWTNEIEVYPVAIGSTNGIAEIYGESTGASLLKGWAGISNAYHSTVPVFTFDTLFATRFLDKSCMILVDIEGAENMLLEGAQQFLEREYILWIMEITTTENQPSGIKINPNLYETFEQFWNQGYVSVAIVPGLPEISRSSIDEIYKTGKSPYKTYNYLFYRPDDLFRIRADI